MLLNLLVQLHRSILPGLKLGRNVRQVQLRVKLTLESFFKLLVDLVIAQELVLVMLIEHSAGVRAADKLVELWYTRRPENVAQNLVFELSVIVQDRLGGASDVDDVRKRGIEYLLRVVDVVDEAE